MTGLKSNTGMTKILGAENKIRRSNTRSCRNGSKQERGVIVGTGCGKVANALLLSVDDLGTFLTKRLQEGKQVVTCAFFFRPQQGNLTHTCTRAFVHHVKSRTTRSQNNSLRTVQGKEEPLHFIDSNTSILAKSKSILSATIENIGTLRQTRRCTLNLTSLEYRLTKLGGDHKRMAPLCRKQDRGFTTRVALFDCHAP